MKGEKQLRQDLPISHKHAVCQRLFKEKEKFASERDLMRYGKKSCPHHKLFFSAVKCEVFVRSLVKSVLTPVLEIPRQDRLLFIFPRCKEDSCSNGTWHPESTFLRQGISHPFCFEFKKNS